MVCCGVEGVEEMFRFIAGLLVVAQIITGCATVKPSPAQGQTREKMAQDRAECSAAAAQATDSKALKEGVVTGGIVGFYLALVGASEGASVGFWTHGSAGDGAWIGAAVGAGIGTIVGLVVGIKKGVEQHRRYQSAYESCLTERGYSI